jgi:glucose-6-phosphate 1-dehydrogenase
MHNGLPTSMIIFGASGDLTARKLIPSMFNLCRKQRIPRNLRIIGFGGTAFTDEEFRQHLLESVQKFADFRFTNEQWEHFSTRLFYQQGRYTEAESFQKLDRYLSDLEEGPANRLFYLATPPTTFLPVIELLGQTGQLAEADYWRRVVIEKPFGTDLSTARQLNQEVHKALNENQIYRIDHYLGKETVQNILMTRFANTIFEPLWNRNYVDHVQITVAEEVGVGHRGGYYDGVGVLRDMFQNHLLQLLSLIAMEPPASFNADALRNEKVKLLSSIQALKGERVATDTVLAQYNGYLQEADVDPKSTTPTYAALRLSIDNWRWQGVPFYLRSGKHLTKKESQIIIQFKEPPHLMFPRNDDQQPIRPNMLVLYLQPDEGVHLRFEAKVPDTVAEMRSVDMEFHYASSFGPSAIPEAYERLLLDALTGDAALFTRADEVEIAWGLIDPIIQTWESNHQPPVATYEPGSWGPAEADELLARDGRAWMMGSQEHIQLTRKENGR